MFNNHTRMTKLREINGPDACLKVKKLKLKAEN
ncbi:hypothetical protein BMS3Bbin11_01179 [bacterium BMS3Bbin11]|nr:hypothetical protein BMS3Abin11_01580 [bacterium BMS3Abin11]GBE46084.1 hypothetical protein BMS3Bbin11_01179 [bacterium BMS3Bbin11]GMT39938.1 MAG: hypothetical protein IEMM0001_0673 [bacterium]